MNNNQRIEELENILNKGLPYQYTYIPKYPRNGHRYDKTLAQNLISFDYDFPVISAQAEILKNDRSTLSHKTYTDYVTKKYTERLLRMFGSNSIGIEKFRDAGYDTNWMGYKKNRMNIVFMIVYHHIRSHLDAIMSNPPISMDRGRSFNADWLSLCIRPMNILTTLANTKTANVSEYFNSVEYQEIADLLVPNRNIMDRVNDDSSMADIFNWAVITVLKSMVPMFKYRVTPVEPMTTYFSNPTVKKSATFSGDKKSDTSGVDTQSTAEVVEVQPTGPRFRDLADFVKYLKRKERSIKHQRVLLGANYKGIADEEVVSDLEASDCEECTEENEPEENEPEDASVKPKKRRIYPMKITAAHFEETRELATAATNLRKRSRKYEISRVNKINDEIRADINTQDKMKPLIDRVAQQANSRMSLFEKYQSVRKTLKALWYDVRYAIMVFDGTVDYEQEGIPFFIDVAANVAQMSDALAQIEVAHADIELIDRTLLMDTNNHRELAIHRHVLWETIRTRLNECGPKLIVKDMPWLTDIVNRLVELNANAENLKREHLATMANISEDNIEAEISRYRGPVVDYGDDELNDFRDAIYDNAYTVFYDAKRAIAKVKATTEEQRQAEIIKNETEDIYLSIYNLIPSIKHYQFCKQQAVDIRKKTHVEVGVDMNFDLLDGLRSINEEFQKREAAFMEVEMYPETSKCIEFIHKYNLPALSVEDGITQNDIKMVKGAIMSRLKDPPSGSEALFRRLWHDVPEILSLYFRIKQLDMLNKLNGTPDGPPSLKPVESPLTPVTPVSPKKYMKKKKADIYYDPRIPIEEHLRREAANKKRLEDKMARLEAERLAEMAARIDAYVDEDDTDEDAESIDNVLDQRVYVHTRFSQASPDGDDAMSRLKKYYYFLHDTSRYTKVRFASFKNVIGELDSLGINWKALPTDISRNQFLTTFTDAITTKTMIEEVELQQENVEVRVQTNKDPYSRLLDSFFKYGGAYYSIKKKRNDPGVIYSSSTVREAENVLTKEATGKVRTAYINLSPVCDMLDINPQIILNALGTVDNGCVIDSFDPTISKIESVIVDLFKCGGCGTVGGTLIVHDSKLWRICSVCMSKSYRPTDCPNVLKHYHQPARRVIEYFDNRQLVLNPTITDYAVRVKSRFDTMEMDNFCKEYTMRLQNITGLREFINDFSSVPLADFVTLCRGEICVAFVTTLESAIDKTNNAITNLRNKYKSMIAAANAPKVEVKEEKRTGGPGERRYGDTSTKTKTTATVIDSGLVEIQKWIGVLENDVSSFHTMINLIVKYSPMLGALSKLFRARPNISAEMFINILIAAYNGMTREDDPIIRVTNKFIDGTLSWSYCSESKSSFPARFGIHQSRETFLGTIPTGRIGDQDTGEWAHETHRTSELWRFVALHNAMSARTMGDRIVGESDCCSIVKNSRGNHYVVPIKNDALPLGGRKFLKLNDAQLNFVFTYMASEVTQYMNAYLRYESQAFKYDTNKYITFSTICQNETTPTDSIFDKVKLIKSKDNCNLEAACNVLLQSFADITVLDKFQCAYLQQLSHTAEVTSGINAYTSRFEYASHMDFRNMIMQPHFKLNTTTFEVFGIDVKYSRQFQASRAKDISADDVIGVVSALHNNRMVR